MDAPAPLQSAADEQDDITIARREYEDENVITVDFGRDVEAHLDIVGNTAIVVAGDRQFEFEIPDEATDVTTNDGMLVITE
ncbi:hypothetical protein [Halorussus sp. MSC15.2]|uniref:DUF7127 family protein n=1 Tax=Halorussus sp. MSC15.2 TaxID=2283638 RepID=UPI0013D01E50|nr:hypothetical protein [Halorussus sp. MSC15.2]NEU56293.1 hypothetical protein [Halorussus sp. MSC15.2]